MEAYILRAQVLIYGIVGFHSHPSCGHELRDDVCHNPKQALLVQLPRNLCPLPVERQPSSDRLPSINILARVTTHGVGP